MAEETKKKKSHKKKVDPKDRSNRMTWGDKGNNPEILGTADDPKVKKLLKKLTKN